MQLVCDIGGSKTRLAVKVDENSFSEPIVFSTPDTPDETVRTIAKRAEEISSEPTEMIVGGIAAIIGRDGHVHNSAHLRSWIGVNVRDLIRQYIEADALFLNDAAVVGLGEAHFGAARGYELVVYLTVSTGLGGARIVAGEIDAYSEGSEPGHQIVDHTSGDTLEDLVSGSGFETRFGVSPKEVEDPQVWEEAARILAIGVTNTILHWSPQAVVLGGPMIVGDPAIPIDSVRDHVHTTLNIFSNVPDIIPAELEDYGGLYGALALLK